MHTLLLYSTTARAQLQGPDQTSKLHVVADAQGRFVRGCLTAGQRHDAPQVLPLLGELAPVWLIADCGYDADPLVAALAARGSCAVILLRRKWRHLRVYDPTRYAQRHPIERLFSRPSSSAIQYDKFDTNFPVLIYPAATVLWLRDC